MGGRLDDVRVYDRELTLPEIGTLANIGYVIRDSLGTMLDGEFGGALPSGNVAEGGDFVMTFTLNVASPSKKS